MRLSLAISLALLVSACGSGDDDDDDVVTADADPRQPDADPSAPDAMPADCQFDGTEYDFLAETLQLESPGGGTCVRLTRRNDCQDICLAHPFTLLTFRMVHDGTGVYVDTPLSLHWEATHHNWNDWAEATSDGIRYRLELTFVDNVDDEWNLWAHDGETVLWGPVELDPHVP